jgi:Alpha/beta hydrolase family
VFSSAPKNPYLISLPTAKVRFQSIFRLKSDLVSGETEYLILKLLTMAALSQDIDWDSGARQGMVSIGTHALALDVSGPDRITGQPVVIIMHGLTGTMSEWPAARRLISSVVRVIDYDRSGLGLSEEGPDPPTALTASKELSALLEAARIEPPYITLAHSWGAILSLEFMNSRPQDISAMVFSDGTAPGFWSVLPMFPMVPGMKAVMEGVDYKGAIGLKSETKLSSEEWDAYQKNEKENEKSKRQGGKEFAVMPETFVEVEKKKLLNQSPPKLEDRPVCVIKGNHPTRDIIRVYEKGVALGNGTDEERKEVTDAIGTWIEKEKGFHESFLTLSSKNRWIDATQSGHWVHHTEPELIAEGVHWVLENLEA